MAFSADAYRDHLQALLPQGAAWSRDPAAALTRLLHAIADGMAAFDGRADALLDEADPRSAAELLPDWERVCGLPGPCAGPAPTLAERRAAVVSKLTSRGGQSIAFFVALAASLGYTVTITEFRPATCNSACTAAINPHPWHYAWRVDAPAETVRVLTCNSGCDEAIRHWGNEVLECSVRAAAPAHTHVLFGYGSGDDWGELVDPPLAGEDWGAVTATAAETEDWGELT